MNKQLKLRDKVKHFSISEMGIVLKVSVDGEKAIVEFDGGNRFELPTNELEVRD